MSFIKQNHAYTQLYESEHTYLVLLEHRKLNIFTSVTFGDQNLPLEEGEMFFLL